MKRKQLEELGLEKEQIDTIMKINGDDIEHAKEVASAEAKNLQLEVDSLTAQVKERDTQLETLKASTGDNEALKQQIATLQADNETTKKNHEAEMNQLKVDFAVEKALSAANAKNAKAVKALLDLTDAKLDKDGNVKGLQEQIDKLVADESSSFLFEAPATDQQQKFQGFQPGVTTQTTKPGEVAPSKMTYDELCAYLAENPNALGESE